MRIKFQAARLGNNKSRFFRGDPPTRKDHTMTRKAMMLALLITAMIGASANIAIAATETGSAASPAAATITQTNPGANTDVGAANLINNWTKNSNPDATDHGATAITENLFIKEVNQNAGATANTSSAMATAAGKGITTGTNTWKFLTGNTAVAHVANAVNNIPVSAAFGGFITS